MRCPQCNGSKMITQTAPGYSMMMASELEFKIMCPHCQGVGAILTPQPQLNVTMAKNPDIADDDAVVTRIVVPLTANDPRVDENAKKISDLLTGTEVSARKRGRPRKEA